MVNHRVSEPTLIGDPGKVGLVKLIGYDGVSPETAWIASSTITVSTRFPASKLSYRFVLILCMHSHTCCQSCWSFDQSHRSHLWSFFDYQQQISISENPKKAFEMINFSVDPSIDHLSSELFRISERYVTYDLTRPVQDRFLLIAVVGLAPLAGRGAGPGLGAATTHVLSCTMD